MAKEETPNAGTVVALASPPTPPETPEPPDTLAAGVDAARRIEESIERVRRARAHAKDAKKSDARKGARSQLKRVLRALHARQEKVLSEGIQPEEQHTLVAHLHAVDRALEEFAAVERPKRPALEQIGQAAKTLRKAL